MDIKEEINLSESMKTELLNMPPLQDFLNIKSFKLPKTFEECQERSKKNLGKFKGNYIALSMLFGVVYLLFNPYALLTGIFWGVYLYFSSKEELFEVKGVKFTPQHLLYLAGFVTFVCFIFLNRLFINFLIIFSVFFILLCTHLFVYEVDEEIVKEEEKI